MSCSHLWNNLPLAERERLSPFMIETHLLHLKQVRSLIVDAHKAELRKLDDWIKNVERSLEESAPQITAQPTPAISSKKHLTGEDAGK